MRKNFILGLLICPILLSAQEHGIAFVHDLNWPQILQKAKTENKYVFVDCYATWCGPCKYMDKEVYPNDSVGAFVNDHFIAVRLQMDTTKNDGEIVCKWYPIAHSIQEDYRIDAYPSFIFISPDGQPVHMDVGGRVIAEFLAMATAALDKKQQYFTLLANYRNGIKDYSSMPVLADEAKKVKQDSLAAQVGRDYLQHYLAALPETKLWSHGSISFVFKHPDVILYKDLVFQLWCKDRKLVDSVMQNPGFADQLINDVVFRDKVKPALNTALRLNRKPNWSRLQKEISNRCGEKFAEQNVVQGRVEYYKATKTWTKYVKYFILQQEANGIESWQESEEHELYLNNNAFEVFQYSSRKQHLKKALSWVERALAMANKEFVIAQDMDTKANILYKLGNKREALALEAQSHKLSPQDKDIASNYEKMKSGLPTWLN